ncbi:MAG: SDR family oxidoreductase [Polyangiaceae bacterium]
MAPRDEKVVEGAPQASLERGQISIYARRVSTYLLRRIEEANEIAGVAVFLASAAGGFVTGHTIFVDGGATITGG